MLALKSTFQAIEKQHLKLVKTPSVEETLVAELKEGKAIAIKQLYQMYAPALNGIIKRIIKYDEIAEDVLQDTFVKIWKSIGQYDATKGRLFTWMANVAKNMAIDQVRCKAHLNASKTDDIGEVSFGLIEHQSYVNPNMETIGIKQLLGHLKQDQQEIIELIYFKGFTHVQVSEILNIPLGTIKTKLRLAILKLRKYFN
ncbi:sigma-70 family RNA polymerase sigma factor [Pedobacter cryotolerans]|uniref:Sigma-70 family RNA polymerase sigma factor n=2 Tax=Pedobacter cryotolerans TaxID=2571270 RepID=A0A4U1C248_9SPHI|nr:sigma-70 family RNA polymerase sigma factor [Pedobacter cryotolerans]